MDSFSFSQYNDQTHFTVVGFIYLIKQYIKSPMKKKTNLLFCKKYKLRSFRL